jgi:hypothetical protein
MTTLFPEALAARKVTNCAICGRPLSDPESQRRGLGPICAPLPPKPPRPVADQPALPGMACRPTEPGQETSPAPETTSEPSEASGRARGAVAGQHAEVTIGVSRWAGTVLLRWRGVEVAVEDKPEEDPRRTLERVFAAWMFLAQGRDRPAVIGANR